MSETKPLPRRLREAADSGDSDAGTSELMREAATALDAAMALAECTLMDQYGYLVDGIDQQIALRLTLGLPREDQA